MWSVLMGKQLVGGEENVFLSQKYMRKVDPNQCTAINLLILANSWEVAGVARERARQRLARSCPPASEGKRCTRRSPALRPRPAALCRGFSCLEAGVPFSLQVAVILGQLQLSCEAGMNRGPRFGGLQPHSGCPGLCPTF